MTVSDVLKSEGIESFGAVKLGDCRVTKERLISDAPGELYAVVLVLPYPRTPSPSLFASFSVIPDYHAYFTEVLSKKLEGLECFANKYMKVFADHSPIDERHAACAAGLGVIGDNGLFISDIYGSFVFLGEIICSLTPEELEKEGVPVCSPPSPPKGCLHCGKCAESCPAGCIGGDKSLCVSNLTQKKGDLSDTEKAIIKKSCMVWGCDACAAVCPMNLGKGKAEYNSYFSKRISPEAYEDIERMSDGEYASFPFSWRKRSVIERNFQIHSSVCSEGERND